MAGRLDGKIALITGAGTGIGEAIAHKFAREGARLLIAGLPGDPIDDVASAILDKGGNAETFLGNLAERETAETCVGEAIKRFDRLDILINNAGCSSKPRSARIIRRRARRDAEQFEDLPRAVLGAMTMLLDAAQIRIGNRSYLEENGTYGATTLLKRHVRFGDHVELEFAGKGGRRARRRLDAPRLQRVLERIADLPGRQLFGWREPDGTSRTIDSGQFNAYLGEISGAPISAKTFRTWGGTVAAFEAAQRHVRRGETPLIKTMSEVAASELSNTPAICRNSYIHPAVLGLSSDEEIRRLLTRQLKRPAKVFSDFRVSESRLVEFLKASRR